MDLSYARSNLDVKRLAASSFEGLGSVYGNVDLGGDIMRRGSLARSVDDHMRAGTMPVMMWQHDPGRVPGKWVEMADTDEGLALKGEFADTPLGNEVATLLKMEAVNGLSIGYQTVDSERRSDGVRVINEAKLFEVSVVSVPMNQEARVNLVKSVSSDNPRALEIGLRDAGVSRNNAKAVVSAVYDLRDAVEYEQPAPFARLEESVKAAALETELRRLMK